MKPIRIAFVLGLTNPSEGAAWTRIGFFADSWSKKGYQVDVLGTFTPTTLHMKGFKRLDKLNIYNFVFNMCSNNPLIFSENLVASFISSTFFFLSRRPDVTIISMPPGDVGLGTLISCKFLKVNHIVDYRDQWEDCSINFAHSKARKMFYSGVNKFASLLFMKCQSVTAVTLN
jgi:hypothetical protein